MYRRGLNTSAVHFSRTLRILPFNNKIICLSPLSLQSWRAPDGKIIGTEMGIISTLLLKFILIFVKMKSTIL